MTISMFKLFIAGLALWVSLGAPLAVLAQEAVDAAGNTTGPSEPTGAPECTGAGCHQGEGQGEDQGTDQGANQGLGQGANNGLDVSNTNTGADSNNAGTIDAASSQATTLTNTAASVTDANAAGATGGNTANQNTGTGGITTGHAGIGVTQVVNDNTAVVGGQAGLSVSGHQGNYTGDLNLGIGANTANLNAGGPTSVRATNDTTGANSTNDAAVTTTTETLQEIQNDGLINNVLKLAASTGDNMASQNTGDGAITTGNADVGATLVNLLNNTVINGHLWVTVADIFGHLTGNINLPDFAALASLLPAAGGLAIDASNVNTGSDSTNTIDINQTQTATTKVSNDAAINTTIDASAITGGNTADKNTGGGFITTGDGSVTASNISVANTTIEGGNWILALVNAANRWLGFLVGDNGNVRALSPEETIRQIEAHNANTGADSTNTIAVNDTHTDTTHVDNDARINNDVTAAAITGRNTANENTGAGVIATGDAAVKVNAVNIANTTVKNGSLLVAVVNIFGDWLGDLLLGGNSLLAQAAAQEQIALDAANQNTGADSTNHVDIDIDRQHLTDIDNDADITTRLTANIDTGGNRTNRNTQGADIMTGHSLLALHSRSVANLTGLLLDPGLGITMMGLNDTTGFNSTNNVRARINDERVIDINNLANVSTIFGVLANTGGNEASQNTIGGTIITGDAAADVGIDNLINQVLVALGGGGLTVDAELINRLTGAESSNDPHLTLNHDLLTTILNRGLVTNLVDLLFNTGGNTANENTAGGHIVSGDICPTIALHNQLNKVSGVGGNLDLTNQGQVDNAARLKAISGDNTTRRNTAAGPSPDRPAGPCEQPVAVVPTPAPVPPLVEAVGGDEAEEEEEVVVEKAAEEQPVGRVAAAVEQVPVAVGQVLKRFPVAGASPWTIFAVGSLALLAVAHHFDRRQLRPS